MGYVIKAGNRVQVVNDYLTLRALVWVGLVVFLHQLNPDKPVVQVKAKDVPGWARKPVRDAFRFYRELVKYSIDF